MGSETVYYPSLVVNIPHNNAPKRCAFSNHKRLLSFFAEGCHILCIGHLQVIIWDVMERDEMDDVKTRQIIFGWFVTDAENDYERKKKG